MAIGSWFVVPHVPSLVGNLLWGAALGSQVAIPVARAYLTFREE